jgi:hypothetical protein
MERLFVGSPLSPALGDDRALATARVREWAAHARDCAPADVTAHLILAMHSRYAAELEATTAELGIRVIDVPDEIPYEPADAHIRRAGNAEYKLPASVLRRCAACPALMRTRILALANELSEGRPLASAVWFLGVDARDRGTRAHLDDAWGRVAEQCCVILPQPDARGIRQVVVDTPATAKNRQGAIAIMNAGELDRADPVQAPTRPVRAGGTRGFDWAVAPLAVFARFPIAAGQMPVTTVWIGANARANTLTRVGDDYSWFWAASDARPAACAVEALAHV